MGKRPCPRRISKCWGIFRTQMLTFGIEVEFAPFHGDARNVGLAHGRVIIAFTVTKDNFFDSHCWSQIVLNNKNGRNASW
jgi:hypothetical protein